VDSISKFGIVVVIFFYKLGQSWTNLTWDKANVTFLKTGWSIYGRQKLSSYFLTT
jgi:hypothetical protein